MTINNLSYLTIYKYLLFIIAILLPFTDYFSVQITSFSIILLFAAWLFLHNKNELWVNLKANKIIILFLLFYIVNAQGFFRGESNGITEKVLIKKLSLFLLPLVIGTSPKLSVKIIYKIVLVFIASLVVSTFVTFSRGVSAFVTTPEALNQVAELVLIHRPYYGLFCGFAILALILLIKKNNSWLINTLYIITIVYLIYFISLIQAKMSLVSVILSVIALVFLWLIIKNKKAIVLALVIVFSLALGVAYQKSDSFRTYVSYILSKKHFSFSEYNILLVGSINVRFVNWGCAFDIIKENKNWLYGVGAGNAQAKMQACYSLGNQWVYQNKMNTHNQYLEETLYNGVIGLFIFVALITLLGLMSFKRNNFMHLAFLILFSLCCLTESILGRQIGIFFFSFFNALLFFNYKINKAPAQVVSHE